MMPATSMLRPGWRRDFAVALALAALTAAVFASSIRGGWLNFDDDLYVTQNPMVMRGLSADGLRWAWTTGHAANWHPLTWLSLMLDAQCYGDRAAGFHLTSLALHAANAALAYLVLARLTGAPWRSALAAALWAIHPLRVESVAWVAERKDVLSMFFGLGATLAYAAYARRGGGARYAAVVVLMALSLLAKPMFVVLPVLLLLLDFWPLRRLSGDGATAWPIARGPALRCVFEKLPLLGLALASSLITILVQRRGGAMVSLTHEPLVDRLVNAAVSCVRYLGKQVWPADLIPFYEKPLGGWSMAWTVAAAWALTAMTLVCLHQRRTRPWLLVGWLWYLIALTPVIGVVRVGLQAMADRYTYLPSLGLMVMVAWSLPSWRAEAPERRRGARGGTVIAMAALVMGVLALLTVRQIAVWRDSHALWRHTLRIDPTNRVAHSNLASLHLDAGQWAAALAHGARAMQSNPDLRDPVVYVNLGAALVQLGNRDKAAAYFQEALRADPRMSLTHHHLGKSRELAGDWTGAQAAYEEAVRLAPGNAAARTDLARALAERGRPAQAEAEFRRAIAANPRYAPAHQALGVFLARHGLLREAADPLRRATSLDPTLVSAQNNLGVVLNQLGDAAGAAAAFGRALELDPANAVARHNLANTLAALGQHEAAAAVRQASSPATRPSPTQPATTDAAR